ncbi:acyl-CoA dehydrogenase family protein [Eggerthella sp. YY7918]|uniref:acyl-CoA dehydrogenase family protein n=1 Tax=Eggerthella sp. (strain YY7918) TaxID=502558 RepID=UPI0002171579|nr:acyl-CoA dehydrogenase family protein [Eggerthella sp. YY7918]BAK44939.1 acyl-CoA dehydrogenase [Eggerthella sp. YY7918]
MDLTLSDKQKQLIFTFREFGKTHFTDDHVVQWCKDQGLPDEVVKEFVDLYFNLPDLMDNEKGDGFTLTSQALILEELSRCAGATLPFQNDLFNLEIIEEFATSSEFLPVLNDYRHTGRLLFALAISEPNAGSDSMNMQTYTQTSNGKLMLNGVKTYVNNGEYAPFLLVAAIDRDDESPKKYPSLSFWLLPRDLPGITAYPISKIGQSMLPFATISFDNVELAPEYRLSGGHGGFRQLFRLLEIGRVFTCASSVGMAQAAMQDAAAYASQRKAFGVEIGNFQQIELMLTDMEIDLFNMRAMLYRAAHDVETSSKHERLSAALMKRYIPETATKLASKAMQILGGSGYSERSRTGRIWQDCRGNQIAEGTDEIMVYIAGPLILDKYRTSNL